MTRPRSITDRDGRPAAGRSLAPGARRVPGQRVRHRPEQSPQDRDRTQRRHLRRREPAGPHQGPPRRRRRRQARAERGLRQRARHCRSASRSIRRGPTRPTSTSAIPTRSSASPTRTATPRPRASPRPSSPTCRASAGSAAAATGPATSSSRPTASGCSSRSARSRTSTTTSSEKRRADILVFDPGGEGREGLRLGHPQPRRPGHPARHRPGLGLGQRARRPGRSPRPRLRHPRRGRRLLRLALVLHRRPPGPAAQGQAPRAEGQGDRARRAAPVALGLALHDLLHRRPVPRGRIARTRSPPSTAPGTAPDAPATRSSASR